MKASNRKSPCSSVRSALATARQSATIATALKTWRTGSTSRFCNEEPGCRADECAWVKVVLETLQGALRSNYGPLATHKLMPTEQTLPQIGWQSVCATQQNQQLNVQPHAQPSNYYEWVLPS